MKKKIIRFTIATAVSLILGACIFALQAGFSDVTIEFNRIMCDVTFSVGVIFLCVGLLICMTNLGVLDMLSYGMASFINLFRKKTDDKKFVEYLEYKEIKKANRLPWGFLALIGIAYIIIAFIFLLQIS